MEDGRDLRWVEGENRRENVNSTHLGTLGEPQGVRLRPFQLLNYVVPLLESGYSMFVTPHLRRGTLSNRALRHIVCERTLPRNTLIR